MYAITDLQLGKFGTKQAEALVDELLSNIKWWETFRTITSNDEGTKSYQFHPRTGLYQGFFHGNHCGNAHSRRRTSMMTNYPYLRCQNMEHL